MQSVADNLLDPAVLAMCIPILAVTLWGLSSIIRSLRGAPAEDLEDLRSEVQDLRSRIEMLEKGKSRI